MKIRKFVVFFRINKNLCNQTFRKKFQLHFYVDEVVNLKHFSHQIIFNTLS